MPQSVLHTLSLYCRYIIQVASVNSLSDTEKLIWYMSQENNEVIKKAAKYVNFIIVFKREEYLSKQKENLEVVVNSDLYIHECLKENGIMYIANNLDIMYIFVSVL